MRAKERDLQAIQTLNQKSNLKHKEQKNYTIVYKSTSQYPQILMDTFGYATCRRCQPQKQKAT